MGKFFLATWPSLASLVTPSKGHIHATTICSQSCLQCAWWEYPYSRGRYYSWRKHTFWHRMENDGCLEIPSKESLLLDYSTPSCKFHRVLYIRGNVRILNPQKGQLQLPVLLSISWAMSPLTAAHLWFFIPYLYTNCAVETFEGVKKKSTCSRRGINDRSKRRLYWILV